ncbi:MAG TPA: ATP-binding protein [Longimicrobium sp.]|jgi:ATP-dependent DNA helicase RecG|uniref:ATP-binding protein n=1 Tax=Longimicrobium sp. TaxID=2029185 RepID=UPI002EDA749F
MTFVFLGPDPVDRQVNEVMARLAAGDAPRGIERAQVDVKEEPGRRGRDGGIAAGRSENEEAARYLAGEMACLANTAGGGAIILGIADDGTRIGTELGAEWLRHRIFELTSRQLTISVQAVVFEGVRLLVLKTHQAIEPIRVGGKLKWRLNDHCVEIDPTSWHSERLRITGVDWSAQPSGHTLADASAIALEIARRYLRAAADPAAEELASASDADLLHRVHVLDGTNRLTNAGSLLFVGTPHVGVDYIRRDLPGADSTNRIRTTRPLLEQISEIEKAAEAVNRLVHVPGGFAHGQLRAIPMRALREAIINGAVHRDWLTPQPTTVEHVGDRVTVTSPGGFVGGVGPFNIITHPSVPRYRSLAEAVASLRLAEREGIGVDRMVRDMLALGHPEPHIQEVAGPYVRVGLVGGDPDPYLLALLASVQPPISQDVESLLLINHLTHAGWVDVLRAAPVLQRSAIEAKTALDRLAAVEAAGRPVILRIRGVPAGEPEAYRLSDAVREGLKRSISYADGQAARLALILGWARARGRVSSTEITDITGLSVTHVGNLLGALEAEGVLRPGRENRRGRGFYYVAA